jgi:hypothetical protein
MRLACESVRLFEVRTMKQVDAGLPLRLGHASVRHECTAYIQILPCLSNPEEDVIDGNVVGDLRRRRCDGYCHFFGPRTRSIVVEAYAVCSDRTQGYAVLVGRWRCIAVQASVDVGTPKWDHCSKLVNQAN